MIEALLTKLNRQESGPPRLAGGGAAGLRRLFHEGLPIICLEDHRLSSKAAAHLKADLQSIFPMYKVFHLTIVNDRTEITGTVLSGS